MFKTQHIEIYLADAYPDIDKDKRVIRLRCYVNPISYLRALEVDSEIADTLFHKLGKDWFPRPIVDHVKFGRNFPPHSLSFCRHPDYTGDRVFIQSVGISKLEAGKVTPESEDFALMFTVSFEPDDPSVLKDFFQLLHEKLFLTFATLQPELFPDKPWMDLLCRLCDASNPEFVTTDKKFAYCSNCSVNKQEDEHLERIRDAKQAAAVTSEMQEPEKKAKQPRGKDPLENDFNERNRQGRRKSQRVN